MEQNTNTDTGKGQPLTPVFIHGAGSSSDFWHEQQAAFPGSIFLNLPGHGTNREQASLVPAPGAPHAIGIYGGWVVRYIEEAGLTNVVLNGHSMGGGITLTIALRKPDWLRAIVLTCTGARLRVLPALFDLVRTDYSAAVDLVMKMSFAPVAEGKALSYDQKVRRNGTRRQLLRTPPEVTLADYRACDGFDVMQHLGEIELPALCIGAELDELTPPKYIRYLHEQIHGSRLEIVEGAGHMLPLEKPEEYNRRLAGFLGDLDR